MGDLTGNARVSLPDRRLTPAPIWHEKNNIVSNNTQVSEPQQSQFFRRFRRRYDRDHRVTCDSSHWGSSWTSRPEPPDDDATVRPAVGRVDVALVHDVLDLQPLLLACRPTRRPHRAGVARDPCPHRLVLTSS